MKREELDNFIYFPEERSAVYRDDTPTLKKHRFGRDASANGRMETIAGTLKRGEEEKKQENKKQAN